MSLVEQLAREGNGAVQTKEATSVPVKVFLAGPIKHWWDTFPDGTEIWGSPLHQRYTEWRDAVRVAVVRTGFCAVYSPHRAIQGSWHEDLQLVNDMAIIHSDILLDLTPDGVPVEGTVKEKQLAQRHGVIVRSQPPGTDEDLERLVVALWDLKRRLAA